ncbi:type II secretion system F family protein [Clostridium chromiireducens]|uniref:type II secretion system F family protein n=1 Tax=Clostridium chromiireducens TaxID=225345 RepID=UPI003AF8523B
MHNKRNGQSQDKEYERYTNSYDSFKNKKNSGLRIGFLIKNKVDERQLSLVAGSLAQIYKDGISITSAIELVADVLSNKIYKSSLVNILDSVKKGKSLSQAFAEYKELYPEFFTGIISIGENTGKLYEVLIGLKVYYDKSTFIKREIRNASAYPLFILLSMIILGIFLISIIVPNFCDIYKSMNIELPANCKFVYGIYNIVKSNLIFISISAISWIIALIIFLKCFLKQLNAEKFIKIKIVKLVFEYIMILLFSIITSTGINISYSLEYCEKSININFLKSKIKEINTCILGGNTLTESLEKTGIFSKYTIAIVRLREESGTIEEGFKELSNNLEYNLNEQIKKYLRLISPTFVIIMASFIAFFLADFILPLFGSLKSGIR